MYQERQVNDELKNDSYQRMEKQGEQVVSAAQSRFGKVAAVVALFATGVIFSQQYQITNMKTSFAAYDQRIQLLEGQLSLDDQTSLNEDRSIEELAAKLTEIRNKKRGFFISKNDDDIQETVKALDAKLIAKVDAEIKKLDALLEKKIQVTSSKVDTTLEAQIKDKTAALDKALQAKILAAGNALDSKLEAKIKGDEDSVNKETSALKKSQSAFEADVLKARSDLDANDVSLDARIKNNEGSLTSFNAQFGKLESSFNDAQAASKDSGQDFFKLQKAFNKYQVNAKEYQMSAQKSEAKNLDDVQTRLSSEIAKLQTGFQASLIKMNEEVSLAADIKQKKELTALEQSMAKTTAAQLTAQKGELDGKIGAIEMSINGQFMLCSGDKEECKCKAGNTVRAVFLDQYGYFKSVNQVFKKDAVQCNSEEFGVTSDTDLQFSCYCRLNTAAKWGK